MTWRTNIHERRRRPLVELGPLLLLLFILSAAHAQTCQPTTASSNLCADYVPTGTLVYIPPDLSLPFLELAAQKYVSGALYVTSRDDTGYLQLVQLICTTWLRPCAVYNNETLIAPVQPCYDICHTYYVEQNAKYIASNSYFGVGFYLPPNEALPMDCNETDTWAGGRLFPTGGASIYNATISIPCRNETLAVDLSCQDPLVRGSPPDYAATCYFECPLPALTESQYDSAKIMQGIMSWFSWAGTAVVIISYLLNPSLREFPRNLILLCALSANIAAGGILLPTLAGYHEIWCGGENLLVRPDVKLLLDQLFLPSFELIFDYDQLSFETGPCTFQGWLIQFGFLGATFLWVCIAFNMSLEILMVYHVEKLQRGWFRWTRFAVYLLVSWGTAFTFSVIPAAGGAIRFVPGATYCFLSSVDDNAWLLTFWFLPVGLALLVGFVLFLLALGCVAFNLIRLRKWTALLNYWRVLAFVFLYLFVFSVIFAYNIKYAISEDDIREGFEEYFTCLVTNPSGECNLPDSVSNYDLVMLRGWAISSLGILLTITFFSWDIIKFWWMFPKSLFLAIRHQDVKFLKRAFSQMVSTRTHTLTTSQDLSLSVDVNPMTPSTPKEDDSKEEDASSSSEDASSTQSKGEDD